MSFWATVAHNRKMSAVPSGSGVLETSGWRPERLTFQWTNPSPPLPPAAGPPPPGSPRSSSASSWRQRWLCWVAWSGSSRNRLVTAATGCRAPSTWRWDTWTDRRPPEDLRKDEMRTNSGCCHRKRFCLVSSTSFFSFSKHQWSSVVSDPPGPDWTGFGLLGWDKDEVKAEINVYVSVGRGFSSVKGRISDSARSLNPGHVCSDSAVFTGGSF